MLTTDTPDIHGRGTLNGVIPYPSPARLFEDTASTEQIPLQRSAQTGVLTDLSYVQLVGDGAASIDVGFPVRYSHSALEVCDLAEPEQLIRLLIAVAKGVNSSLNLKPDNQT